MDIGYWKRNRQTEMAYRCAVIEGMHVSLVADKAVDLLGLARSLRVPPIDCSSNPIRRLLGVISRVRSPAPAVTGLSVDMATLIGDASSSVTRERYAKIKAVPMPTSLLLGGGEQGGLLLALDYLQVCGYVGVAVGWSRRNKRPYIRVVRPCDLEVTYAPDDPSVVVEVRETRKRSISGVLQEVVDVWDLRDVDKPSLTVEQGGTPVTGKVDGIDTSQLSGAGYWWKLQDGTPFIPIVVYGSIGTAMQNIHLTEGAITSGVYRTCLAASMLDSGFPGRNVRGMKTGTDTQPGSPGPGTTGQATMPGDVVAWRDSQDGSVPEHWEWTPGSDPEKMFRVVHAYDADLISQLGVPVELSSTGGEPLAHELEEQEAAIRRWYDRCAVGDAELFRDLAAVRNRALKGRLEPESGHGFLYREQITEALAAVEPKPTAEQPETKEGPENGEDNRGA